MLDVDALHTSTLFCVPHLNPIHALFISHMYPICTPYVTHRYPVDMSTPQLLCVVTATVKVQDRVLDALEKKHSTEMGILMKLASKADEEDYVEQGLYINNVVCCILYLQCDICHILLPQCGIYTDPDQIYGMHNCL